MLRLELEALAAQDFSLELTGFDEQELKDLLAEVGEVSLLDADETPEPQARAVTVPGDLWILGKPIECSVAMGTRWEDLARLLEGKHCDLVFTDLPYNVDYCGKTSRKMKLANDNLGSEFGSFLEAALPGTKGMRIASCTLKVRAMSRTALPSESNCDAT